MSPGASCRFLCRTVLVSLGIFIAAQAHAGRNVPPLTPEAAAQKVQAAVVIDADSGEVLFASNTDQRIIPASLVKMMTALVALEKADRGEVDLSAQVRISAKASKIGGHQVFLKAGETFELRELLKAVMIGSANDAAYAVAEHVAGSEIEFVKVMNERAAQLGMKDTEFHNPHGLPPNKRKGQLENYTTVTDLAILGRELSKHRHVTTWASTKMDTFRNGSFQLLNTNHRFLAGFEGATGLKTGYHPRGAGFCMVGTAKRDGRRLLTVVVGARSARDRLKTATVLLDAAFKRPVAVAQSN